MIERRRIRNALISTYNKEGLVPIATELKRLNAQIISTGGTQSFLEGLGIEVTAVEQLTSYPSIFDGRVKTLHPIIFGGILHRRGDRSHLKQAEEHQIPPIDLVLVDLYPFEETLRQESASHEELIEKIDIGGVTLLRAAAKNFCDVLVVSSTARYDDLLHLLQEQNGETSLEQRKQFAVSAFQTTFSYDRAIKTWFERGEEGTERAPASVAFGEDLQQMFGGSASMPSTTSLRYGENPHQKALFVGEMEKLFTQLNGKEISYNNLLDIDAAVNIMTDFNAPTVAILKHNNACGLASHTNLLEAWKRALAGDPISAFGGVIIVNQVVSLPLAEEIDKLFFEVLLAPAFCGQALALLKWKKNRILLQQKSNHAESVPLFRSSIRTVLNGLLVQDKDDAGAGKKDLSTATQCVPTEAQIEDLLFANKIVKASKSNAIVLAKNQQLIASGVGETSRVDALRHAIEKAKHFGFDLQGAVMASDAFFPFSDCVEMASQAGINAVIQPGGSVRDNESIDFCNKQNMVMVFTGTRHFKH